VRYSLFAATAVACVLLAGCDQNPKSSDVTIKGRDGSVTISANGQNFTMKANDDKNGSVTMSANGGHFVMKASDGKQTVDINATGGSPDVHMPGFVTMYPGAKVKSTTVNAGASGAAGSIMFETPDSPARVIEYYKRKSADAGFARQLDMNTGTTTVFTANAEGGKKTLQVIAANSGSGAQVQVNWSGK
jgi:hypothetical protein